MRFLLLIVLISTLSCRQLVKDNSSSIHLTIDNDFADWEPITPAFTGSMPVDDTASLVNIGLAKSRRSLYLLLTFTSDVSLQRDHSLNLKLRGLTPDGKDSVTMIWHFGARYGIVKGDTIRPDAVRLAAAPSYDNNQFEVAIDHARIISSDNMLVTLATASESWTLKSDVIPLVTERTPVTIDMNKKGVRIASFNIESNGLFDSARNNPLQKILQYVNPDILLLQEVYDNTAEEVTGRLKTLLRADALFVEKRGPDLIVASKFPITKSELISSYEYGAAAFFAIDWNQGANPLYLVNFHYPCCSYPEAEPRRIALSQAVLAYLKERLDSATGSSTIPIIAAGDLNLVQQRVPLEILERAFRAGDYTYQLKTVPLLQADGSSFTWRKTDSRFIPAQLDFMLANPDQVSVLKGQVFSSEWLSNDVMPESTSFLASDHLIIWVDVEANSANVESK